MLTLVLSSLYFFLPAAFANTMPVIVKKIPVLNFPISKKYLGENKTYRGFLFGYIGALLVLFIQFYLQGSGIISFWNGDPVLTLSTAHDVPRPIFSILDYENINLFLFAFIFGIGALTGDSIKSFFKRRLNIASGRPFVPFDQIDFVIGVYIFMLPFSPMPWIFLVTLLVIIPILHFSANVIAYLIGLKKVWW